MANSVAWKNQRQLHACMQFVFLLWGRGCILWYAGRGCATDTLKLLGSTAIHTHTSYTMGVRPPSFEMVRIREWTYFEWAVLYPWLSPPQRLKGFFLTKRIRWKSECRRGASRLAAQWIFRFSACTHFAQQKSNNASQRREYPDVWQDFISRCSLALTKPMQKFPRQQTRDGLVNLRFSMYRTSLSVATNQLDLFRELLCSAPKQEHFVNRKGVNHNL